MCDEDSIPRQGLQEECELGARAPNAPSPDLKCLLFIISPYGRRSVRHRSVTCCQHSLVPDESAKHCAQDAITVKHIYHGIDKHKQCISDGNAKTQLRLSNPKQILEDQQSAETEYISVNLAWKGATLLLE